MGADFRERYGPWALVAGASEGLGAEFARQLAARGLGVLAVARRREKLEELRRELADAGAEVRVASVDLAAGDLEEAVASAAEGLQIGLLVCNAALSNIGAFLDRPIEDHLRALEVNCRSPLVLAHRFGREMRERRRGGIVLMSSMSGLQGTAWVAHYAATKAYNRILAEGLWDELRDAGVDVVACCAGATRTPGYLASNPASPGLVSAPVMDAAPVVAETLARLGRAPSFVPGRVNRLASFLMQRLLPRRAAIATIGRTTRAMYAASE